MNENGYGNTDGEIGHRSDNPGIRSHPSPIGALVARFTCIGRRLLASGIRFPDWP
ncbi:hypothetical protein AB0H49_20640 [Nocardia sp. NPDC050713]|uniref:hypothetical protein n=1 Tax=Nocardia sp. NPDC050713 TaxID=3154511 RepID=UPI0033E1F187